MIKKSLCFCLCAVLFVMILSGCAVQKEEGPVVDTIYIGHHYVPEIDPTWRSPITGEPGMSPDKLLAATKALETVKEKLGVDIKWKQWTSSADRECLQTVLAGDPYCHLAVLSNGNQATLLTQNVLQSLDPYLDIFEDPDRKWLLPPEVFGSHYLLNRDLIFVTDWPICFNIDMIEAVPSLRDENGKTIFPYDLYKQGKWTWSVFEDYLEKIQAYYSGRKSANGNPILAFDTNYTYLLQLALHSNGAYLYNGNGMSIDTPEAIEAVEFLDSLISRGLLNCSAASFGKSTGPGYMTQVDKFYAGETVFTNCARWKMAGASNTFAERGESMGIMFFPRPDDIPFTEEYVPGQTPYEICIACCDSLGLLKGFSYEESHLAVEAYTLYTMELYKNIGRVDTIAEYREKMAPHEALTFGIDIFHPEVGDDNLAVFSLLGSLPENEFGEVMSLLGTYSTEIFGKSVYGIGGSPKYPIAVQAKKSILFDRMETISGALSKENAVDAVAPSVALKNPNMPVVFPLGTDPKDIDWAEIFSASDNVDGAYDIKTENGKLLIKANPDSETELVHDFEADRMSVDYQSVDFDTLGSYPDAVTVSVTDTYGNVGERKFLVYIYDEENTRPPILELKEEFSPLPLDTDTSTVNWAANFVEKAEDVTGIDLKAFVSADVRELDVTEPGVYPVTIYVTDIVGNRTEIETMIEIKR